MHLLQMPQSHMRINLRSSNIGMTEQSLHTPQIRASFQEVRRETRAERMDTVAVCDPCGPLGVLGDFLRGAAGHGPVGIKARK